MPVSRVSPPHVRAPTSSAPMGSGRQGKACKSLATYQSIRSLAGPVQPKSESSSALRSSASKTSVFRTKNSQPMGYQDRYEDSMQLDRVTRILFRLSISGIMAHSGIPTHASEGSLGPRGRCVSPRAGPLIPAQPISHRPRQSMSALKRGDADS